VLSAENDCVERGWTSRENQRQEALVRRLKIPLAEVAHRRGPGADWLPQPQAVEPFSTRSDLPRQLQTKRSPRGVCDWSSSAVETGPRDLAAAGYRAHRKVCPRRGGAPGRGTRSRWPGGYIFSDRKLPPPLWDFSPDCLFWRSWRREQRCRRTSRCGASNGLARRFALSSAA